MRLRWPIVIAWLVVARRRRSGRRVASRRSSRTSSAFPGTDSERVRTVLQQHFGDRSDGAFTVVFRVADSADPRGARAAPARRRPRGARRCRAGRATALEAGRAARPLRQRDLDAQPRARRRATPTTSSGRSASRPGRQAYVTGAPAIQHDLDPIFNDDLQKGESIALPIALLVLLLVFGLSLGGDDPVPVRGAARSSGRSGSSTSIAHYMTTPTYVTNLVFLIGLGIAIDYSLLIVYRFREELGARAGGRGGDRADDADRRPRRDLLGRDGRDRARAAALHAAPVHARDGGRRVPDPDRLDPRRGDAPARAALDLRPARHAPRAVAAFLRDRLRLPVRGAAQPTTSSTASGRGSRARSCGASGATWSRSPRCSSPAAIPVGWLQLTPGRDRRDPAVPAVGARAERARGRARAGRDRAGAGARRQRARRAACATPPVAGGDRAAGRRARRAIPRSRPPTTRPAAASSTRPAGTRR